MLSRVLCCDRDGAVPEPYGPRTQGLAQGSSVRASDRIDQLPTRCRFPLRFDWMRWDRVRLWGTATGREVPGADPNAEVRNRERRFTLLQPSTQDISRDPPPAVGTYEPTVGADEHKVHRVRSAPWKHC